MALRRHFCFAGYEFSHTMNESAKFDKIILELRDKYRSEDLLTVEASNFPEIKSTIESVDRQLRNCQSLIMESMNILERNIIVVDDFERKCAKIVNYFDEMKEYEENTILPKFVEIAKTREKFSDVINRTNNQFEREREKFDDTRRKLMKKRDNLLVEIESVDGNIKIREMEVEEMKISKIEMDNYRDSLVNEEISLRRLGEVMLEEFNVLSERLDDHE